MLKDRLGEAIFAGVGLLSALFAMVMLISLITTVFEGSIIIFPVLAVAFMVLSAVALGTIRWFWAFILGNPLKLSEMFYYFSCGRLFFKSVMVSLCTTGRCVANAILSFLPAVAVYLLSKGTLLSKFSIEIGDNVSYASPFILLLALFGVALFLFTSLRCVFSFVIVVIDEEIEPYEAVLLSKKITKQSRFSLFLLFFSFAGWIAISMLGVTLIYTLPLLICSYVVTARILITNYCIDNGKTSIKNVQ